MDEKFILQSRRFWGVLAPVIAVALQQSGFTADFNEHLNAVVEGVLLFVGGVCWLVHWVAPDPRKVRLRIPTTAPLILLAALFAAQPAAAFDWKKVFEVKVSILRVELIAAQTTGIWIDPMRLGCYLPGVNKIAFLGCAGEPEIVTTQPAVPVEVE